MTEPIPNGWVRCPKGELDRLAGRLRSRRRWRVLLEVVAAVVATAAIGLTTAGLVGALGSSGASRGGGGCCPPPQQECPPVEPGPQPAPPPNR
ncbi:MAG TPA: hypothetical protein VEL76_28640 [Gemmataceae bacterium]|nr:hypothetical protein [Gemmataceae bacterium]